MNSIKYVRRILLSVLTFSPFSACIAQNATSEKFNQGHCGILHKSLGGETKFPWVATVHTKDNADLFNAAILTPTLVILHAKNFHDLDSGHLLLNDSSNYFISANLSKRGETQKENPYIQMLEVTHVRLHPEAFIKTNWTFFINDFALVHLKTPIAFDDQVHPMCIPTSSEMVENILNLSSNEKTTKKVSLLVSGWRRYTSDNIYNNLTVNKKDTCENWWKFDFNNETRAAPYIDKFCANISSGDTHANCLGTTTSVVGRVNTNEEYYFLGLRNNFYSDNRVCNANTRIIINKLTESHLNFIRNNMRCGHTNFTCDNGQCVHLDKICNSEKDCLDGSDENDLYCDALLQRYCTKNQFRCVSGVRNCISQVQKCDGIIDCSDGEDEENCSTAKRETNLLSIIAPVGVLFTTVLLGVLIYFSRGPTETLSEKEVKQYLSELYNKPDIKIEIPKEKLKIERGKELGRGEFSIVYKGVYDIGDEIIDVAVKTFKASGSNSTNAFEVQLSELGIMSRIGHHDNIVKFLGVYLKEIKHRVLHIVVELCPLGSLSKYLTQNRDRFMDLIDRDGNIDPSKYQNSNRNSSTQYENIVQIEKSFTTIDLLLWSHQIASAMEYLAAKKVSHGDLAARNILLTENYIAKLSDFGLSCDFDKMQAYKKKRDKTRVPLRWVAIECLQDTTLQFSTESDIWGYGITIWEIFSLGQMPYPGIPEESIHDEIVNKGRRPEEPDFGSKEIYAKMRECWNAVPDQRPNFSSLQTYFQGLLHCLDYVSHNSAWQ